VCVCVYMFEQVILLGYVTEGMLNTERYYIHQFLISFLENCVLYLLFDPLISTCFLT